MPTVRICKNCKKEFKRAPSKPTQCCSVRCSAIYKQKRTIKKHGAGLPPENFKEAWFAPDELYDKNIKLERIGKRICIIHQGPALDLTEKNFLFQYRQTLSALYVCKKCRSIYRSKTDKHYSKEHYQVIKEKVKKTEAQKRLDKKINKLREIQRLVQRARR